VLFASNVRVVVRSKGSSSVLVSALCIDDDVCGVLCCYECVRIKMNEAHEFTGNFSPLSRRIYFSESDTHVHTHIHTKRTHTRTHTHTHTHTMHVSYQYRTHTVSKIRKQQNTKREQSLSLSLLLLHRARTHAYGDE